MACSVLSRVLPLPARLRRKGPSYAMRICQFRDKIAWGTDERGRPASESSWRPHRFPHVRCCADDGFCTALPSAPIALADGRCRRAFRAAQTSGEIHRSDALDFARQLSIQPRRPDSRVSAAIQSSVSLRRRANAARCRQSWGVIARPGLLEAAAVQRSGVLGGDGEAK